MDIPNNLDQKPEKPSFSNTHIAEEYHAGQFNRYDAEIADILASTIANNQLEELETEGNVPLTSEAVEHLSCVAIITGGRIIPVIDLKQTEIPRTFAQKMGLCALAARCLLDALMDIFESWDTDRAPGHNEDDERGNPNCVQA